MCILTDPEHSEEHLLCYNNIKYMHDLPKNNIIIRWTRPKIEQKTYSLADLQTRAGWTQNNSAGTQYCWLHPISAWERCLKNLLSVWHLDCPLPLIILYWIPTSYHIPRTWNSFIKCGQGKRDSYRLLQVQVLLLMCVAHIIIEIAISKRDPQICRNSGPVTTITRNSSWW